MAGIFGLRDVRTDQLIKTTVETVGTRQYGYFGGGFAVPYVCTIERLDFSNETVSAPANLTQARDG